MSSKIFCMTLILALSHTHAAPNVVNGLLGGGGKHKGVKGHLTKTLDSVNLDDLGQSDTFGKLHSSLGHVTNSVHEPDLSLTDSLLNPGVGNDDVDLSNIFNTYGHVRQLASDKILPVKDIYSSATGTLGQTPLVSQLPLQSDYYSSDILDEFPIKLPTGQRLSCVVVD